MKRKQIGQISMTNEIIVDLFAGGGGASTGIEIATGRVVNVAVDHNPEAIRLHQTNHKFTEHYQEDVWKVDPKTVCKGRPVGLLWASPDCRHFSKAKGAALVDRKIRGLAWVILRWAGEVRPRVILMENVEEFVTWGPVRKGKPVKKLSGTTFEQFLKQLRALGYEVEYCELVAADYGAPTSRKRLVLCARCDGRPIVWPERTHAPAGSPEVLSGKCKPWRSAAEILDFSRACPSIFDTKAEIKAKYGLKAQRPLADNTMRRIICGTDKFTIKSAQPYAVECNHSGPGHTADLREPCKTITAKHTGGICTANLMQYHDEKGGKARVNGVEDPLATVDAANRHGLRSVQLTEFYGNGRPLEVESPLRTVTARDREALTVCHLDKYYGGGYTGVGNSPREPLTTVIRYEPGKDLGHWPKIRALLNRFCGYELADDELILLNIAGVWYYISDIGLRMLTPRELYAAMGFPADYIIDRDYLGNEYPKDQQIAKCGNSVPPPLAEAMVRANLPEWCGGKIKTMEELRRHVAV